MWLTGLSSIYIRESKFLVQGAVTATIGTRLENKGLLLQGDQSFNFCIFNVLCSFRVFLLIYISTLKGFLMLQLCLSLGLQATPVMMIGDFIYLLWKKKRNKFKKI